MMYILCINFHSTLTSSTSLWHDGDPSVSIHSFLSSILNQWYVSVVFNLSGVWDLERKVSNWILYKLYWWTWSINALSLSLSLSSFLLFLDDDTTVAAVVVPFFSSPLHFHSITVARSLDIEWTVFNFHNRVNSVIQQQQSFFYFIVVVAVVVVGSTCSSNQRFRFCRRRLLWCFWCSSIIIVTTNNAVYHWTPTPWEWKRSQQQHSNINRKLCYIF